MTLFNNICSSDSYIYANEIPSWCKSVFYYNYVSGLSNVRLKRK